MSARKAAIARLLTDLRRSETRGSALRRVRSRAVRELRLRTGRPASTGSATVTGGVPSSATGGAELPDSWYVGEWVRLAKAVFGPGAAAIEPAVAPVRGPEALKQAARQRAEAALAEAIAQGQDLEPAVIRSVAALADVKEWHAAWALAEGIGRLPGGAIASAMGHAVLLHRRQQFARAWNVVVDLDDDALARSIPVEAVDGALATGTVDARRRALSIATPSAGMSAPVLVDLAGRLLAFGEPGRAAELMKELRRRSPADIDERRRHAGTLIERWLERRPAAVPAGSIPVAVLGYQTPDHVLTSGNLGDHIQTLSMLGNLARLSEVEFSGDDGLGVVATELKDRVQPNLRLPGVRGSVHLVAVDRDFSSAVDVPAGTWMVAFGWHMHSLYELRYDFPYHPNIRPLFISFHVNRLEMLSDEALAYLRRYGPVGCRDWNTVFLLLSAGVDAFFSGCLTTTVDALYPSRGAALQGKGTVGLIDVQRKSAGRDAKSARMFSHQSDEYRFLSPTEGIQAADAALGAYQRDLGRAVTGRLHAYLPLTALGVPVEFKTGNPGDVRFAGLAGLRSGDVRLTEMRSGIRDLISAVFEKILGGADESEVYASWHDLTRERVAEARARFEKPVVDAPTTIDVAAAVATSHAGSRRFGPHHEVDAGAVTDIVLAFDQNLTSPAAVLLESIVVNASGPLRLWVLARGLTLAYEEWLAAAFPSVPMTFLPCDQIAYGAAGRPRRIPARITISTMDRLLLPNLLHDVDRVVYLDVDTLMLDDVCRLARTDLGGRPVAARDSNVLEMTGWQSAVRPLAEGQATDLRRRMAFRHGFGHAALNAGVLVLDLARMRRDDFAATYLAWVEQYGLHDQDIMLAYVGPDRWVLEPRWNSLPVLEDVRDPSLIHWAAFGKPWDPQLTFEKDRWLGFAARLRDRAGAPPTPA